MSGQVVGEEDKRGDNEAMAVAARGDREARNTLFLEHQLLIKQLARPAARLLRSARTPDSMLQPQDVEQEAFVEFCVLLEEWVPGQTPFLAYLRKMLPWRLLHYVRRATHYRSAVRWVSLSLRSGNGEEDGASVEDTVEDEAARRNIVSIESSDTWKYHTDGLDEGLRKAVSLRYALGLSAQEIASLRGCSPRTVNRELHAARETIRRSIEDKWENCS